MRETACPFCAADVTGIAMRCAKRTVPGEGLSRAAVLALVAAGVDVTGCTTSRADYGAPCAPAECIWPGGGPFGGWGGDINAGGTSAGGNIFVVDSGGTGGRTGATDAASDAHIDVAVDASTDSATDASDRADAIDASASDASPPTDARVKDQSAG